MRYDASELATNSLANAGTESEGFPAGNLYSNSTLPDLFGNSPARRWMVCPLGAFRGLFSRCKVGRSQESETATPSHYTGIITVELGKRGGKPCIRGLRITVYDILEYLASGMTEAEIIADFPDLTYEDIRACLAFAADRERRMVSVSPA